MSYDYNGYQTQLATLMAENVTDANFQTILPGCIDYAEQRIQRELDLLTTVNSDTSLSFNLRNRLLTLPTLTINNLVVAKFITVQSINVLTPTGSTNPSNSTRNPLVPASRDYLDLIYPNVSSMSLPVRYAMFDDHTIIVGPWPDSNYTVEIVGTSRITPLSSTNTTTFLTLELPDLFIAASMVYMSGYMKNFGAQTDNPQMAQSWENQYQILKASADTEEARRKFQSSAWTSYSPSKNATPSR